MTDTSADALAAQLIADAGGGAAPKKKGGLVPLIAVVGGLSLVAIGGGAAVGTLVGGQSAERAAEAAKPELEAAKAAEAKAAAIAADPAGPSAVVKLPVVLTNIATPPKTVLRMEASIVVHTEGVENPEVLAAQIQGDTVAFLRTIDLAQIEGARGLMHLREDLKERAKLRSPAVTDYLVQSLVAQ